MFRIIDDYFIGIRSSTLDKLRSNELKLKYI